MLTRNFLSLLARSDDLAERTFRGWPFLLRTTLAPLCAIVQNRTYMASVRLRTQPVSDSDRARWHYTDEQRVAGVQQQQGGWSVFPLQSWSSIVVMNVAWPASDVLMAPSAQADDGSLYVSAIRGRHSLLTLLRIFLLLEDGTHHTRPECDYFKASEIIVHPHNSSGNMVLSGEPLPVQGMHVKLQAKAACFVF